MDSPNSSNNGFLKKLTEIIEANLTNPRFGVSMLAKEMGMSRSNLHRKVILQFKITVSQYINQVRLKKAKNILRHTSDTVSEVGYKVGYNNVSYFIKCFHEYYGYSPGEIGNRNLEENNSNSSVQIKNTKLKTILIPTAFIVLLAIALIVIFKPFQFQQKKLENTITILPPSFEFLDSSDYSTVDGIIEDVIVNLNKIDEIKITSWFSVLKDRNTIKSAPEIAEERKTNYIVKPSAQGNQVKIFLSLSLMEGPSDDFIDKYTYEIDSNNVTTVHLEILKDITNELDVSITPEERSSIDQLKTANRKALKNYRKGIEILNHSYSDRTIDVEKAIAYFKKAIEYDNEFASAYAQLAITYYWLDFHWSDHSNPNYEVIYRNEINKYADLAIFYDSQLDLSLVAQALFYKNEKEYEMAVFYLEKAQEIYPRSLLIVNNLCRIYALTTNDEKFIKYALKAIDYNFPVNDSTSEFGKELIYTQLGSKYRTLGFFNKSLTYYKEALKVNRNHANTIGEMSQAIMDLGEEDNYQQSKELLQEFIQTGNPSATTYAFLGLSYYVLRDYQNAYNIFQKILENSETEYFSGFPSGRFAVVLSEMGEPKKAQIQINYYREFAESSPHPQIKNYRLIGYYSFKGDTAKALEHMEIMSQYDQQYFRIRLLRDAPLYDNIRELPEFQELLSKMQTRWQTKHDSIRVVFREKGLL